MKTKVKTWIHSTKLAAAGVGVMAATLMATSSQAQSTITWQSPATVTSASILDTITGLYPGATLAQAVDFGNSSVLTVGTPGGQTINFAVGATSFNAPSGSGTMLAYSGTQTLSPGPGTGDANFDLVIQNDGWAASGTSANPQTVQIGGLTSGLTYAVQLFAYDPRASSASRTEEFADTVDATGNNSASFSTASATSVIGTFTASSSLQNVYVWQTTTGVSTWDTTVSAFTLYAVPEPGTLAMLSAGMGMLLLGLRKRRRI